MGDTGVISYRLFRRDCRGSLRMVCLDFQATDERSRIAAALVRTKRSLREKVDVIDLEVLGVAA